MSELLLPGAEWALPPGVHAGVTTRVGGCSSGVWRGFNLAGHVGDDVPAVARNRERLGELLRRGDAGPLAQQWLRQVHGSEVFRLEGEVRDEAPAADALYTRREGVLCAVLTADCLPVLFCSDAGDEIAVAHAGWRGLAGGVLENTLACFRAAPAGISAWLGPAIGPCHFEVGAEVRDAFLDEVPTALRDGTEAAFTATGPDKYHADLYTLARLRLSRAGVTRVGGEVRCSVCDERRWYSYRRDGVTGRNATFIFRTPRA